jgi:hypothetical protein
MTREVRALLGLAFGSVAVGVSISSMSSIPAAVGSPGENLMNGTQTVSTVVRCPISSR